MVGVALLKDTALAKARSEAVGIKKVSFEDTWLPLLELRVPGLAWLGQAAGPRGAVVSVPEARVC